MITGKSLFRNPLFLEVIKKKMERTQIQITLMENKIEHISIHNKPYWKENIARLQHQFFAYQFCLMSVPKSGEENSIKYDAEIIRRWKDLFG